MTKRIVSAFLYFIMFVAVVYCSYCVVFDVRPGFLANLANSASADEAASSLASIKAIYSDKFVYKNQHPYSVRIYVPEYMPEDEERADFLAEALGFFGERSDEGDFFLYLDGERELHIYKYLDAVKIIGGEHEAAGEITAARAAELAGEIIARDFAIFKTDAESLTVDTTERGFSVSFFGRVDGLQNRAYPQRIVLDKAGGFVSAELSSVRLDKVAGAEIITMREAYARLPAEYPAGTRITLNSCELCYILRNSVLEPAYVFEGEYNEGKLFRCQIAAAVFSN